MGEKWWDYVGFDDDWQAVETKRKIVTAGMLKQVRENFQIQRKAISNDFKAKVLPVKVGVRLKHVAKFPFKKSIKDNFQR